MQKCFKVTIFKMRSFARFLFQEIMNEMFDARR